MAENLPDVLQCPVCRSMPSIGVCETWPKDFGPPPWYAVCYREDPSHCIGGNGYDQCEAIEVWNKAVLEIRHPVVAPSGSDK